MDKVITTKRAPAELVSCLLQDAVDIKMLAMKAESPADRNKLSDLAGRLNKIAQDLEKVAVK